VRGVQVTDTDVSAKRQRILKLEAVVRLLVHRDEDVAVVCGSVDGSPFDNGGRMGFGTRLGPLEQSLMGDPELLGRDGRASLCLGADFAPAAARERCDEDQGRGSSGGGSGSTTRSDARARVPMHTSRILNLLKRMEVLLLRNKNFH